MFYDFVPQILYFKFDETGKGGWDDPRDGDEHLATVFLNAVKRQNEKPLSTPKAYGIPDLAGKIMDRLRESFNLIVFLDRPLQPVARKLMEIKSPSDRLNPIIVAAKFEGFELP